MKRLLCGLVALGLLVGGAGQVKADYLFTTMDAPGLSDTQGSGINNAGHVVGFGSANGTHRSFLYSGGNYTPLDVPNAPATKAFGINNPGQIVGLYTDRDGLSSHGFLLSEGKYTLFDMPGSLLTSAYGINDSSQIVGDYEDATFAKHGFLSSGGSYTPLDVPGANATSAHGINSAGQIVGDYTSPAVSAVQGFLLSGGNYTALEVPGGLDLANTYASGINALGQVVGTYYDENSTYHGFLLSGGNYTTFSVPGSVHTFATAINDFGQVVGYYVDDREATHGFVASPIPEPVLVTGYSADVISDKDPAARFAQPFGAGAFAWFESGAVDDSGARHSDGLPAGLGFDSATGSGATYQIQPANTKNVLQLAAGQTGTLTLTTPTAYTKLYVIASSGDGTPSSAGSGTIHFADGSTQTFSFNSFDWCDGSGSLHPEAALPSPTGRADVGPSGTAFLYNRDCGFQVYETVIPIDLSHAGVAIMSIDFTGAADAFSSNIFGVSGQ